jgi:hypothetical protein
MKFFFQQYFHNLLAQYNNVLLCLNNNGEKVSF